MDLKIELIKNIERVDEYYSIEELILMDQGLGFSVFIDIEKYMRLTHGTRHPGKPGCIVIIDDHIIIFDYFGLIEWIIKNGFKRI